MIVYLDSSVTLLVFLRQTAPPPYWGSWSLALSSTLLGVEARRTFHRLRLEGALDDAGLAQAEESFGEFESGIELVPVTRQVTRAASAPFGTHVKTLDALHLATALLLRDAPGLEELQFATLDVRQAIAARAAGFSVPG